MLNRKLLLCAFVSALIAFLLSSRSYAVTPDRIAGPLNGQKAALNGYVHRNTRPEFDQGPADPALRFGSIMLQASLTANQQKALDRLLAQQQDPTSPHYHKWLTPEQWADRFGLSPNDVQKITTWLKAQGFHNIYVARGHNWFTFSGTAAQVQSAFGTEIHTFNVNGETHVANATSPKIPVALAGIITGISGLDDFHLKPRVHPKYYSAAQTTQFLAPGDIATIYDINNLYSGGIDGTGQLLAIIGQTDIFQADIADFRTGFGLSSISCTSDATTNLITACSDAHFSYTLVPNAPDPKKASAGDLAEADLDIEWSSAVARNAQIVYVNAPATFSGNNLVSGGVWKAWYYAVDQNLAPVISMSYGNCEFGLPYSVAGSADETELQKANSEGITFINSTGDSGAAECDPTASNGTDPNGASATQGLAVGYPASSPEVTGAGGTSIALTNFTNSYWNTANGTDGGSAISYVPEQPWNDDEELGAFCAANTANLFCKQGGTTAQTGWVPIVNAKTAQQDIGIFSSGGGPSNCATQNAGLTSCVSGFPQPVWQKVTISGQSAARFSPDIALLSSPNYPGYIICTQLSELGRTGTGSSCANGISTSVDTYVSIIGGTSAAAPVFAGMVTLLNQYLAGPNPFGLGNINPMLYSLAAATPSNGAFHKMTTTDALTNDVFCSPGTPSTMPATMQCPSTGTAVIGFSVSNADATTGYNLVTGLGSVDLDKLALAWAGTRASSSTSVSSSPSQAIQGGSVTLTATVTPSTATGSVSFNSGTTLLGTSALSGGTATLTTTSLPVGSDNINATYNGSGTIASSTSTSIMVTVSSAIASFTPTAASFPVTQGAATNATVTLTLASGFSGQVTFACQNPGSEIICTPPAAVTASGNVSFHLTTQAPSAALRRPFDRNSGIFYAALMPGMVGLAFVAASRKRSLRGLRMLGLIIVLGASTMWLGSCGGSNNSSTSNPGTPKGNYTINVSATPAGGGATQASFTLAVQ